MGSSIFLTGIVIRLYFLFENFGVQSDFVIHSLPQVQSSALTVQSPFEISSEYVISYFAFCDETLNFLDFEAKISIANGVLVLLESFRF